MLDKLKKQAEDKLDDLNPLNDLQEKADAFKAQVSVENLKNRFSPASILGGVKQKIADAQAFIKKMGWAFVAVLAAGFIAGYYLDWWTLAVVAAVVAIIRNMSPKESFAYGLLAGSTLWGMYAGWQNTANAGLLATKMGGLFPVKLTSANFIQVTTLMGGLLGGLGAMTGSLLRGLLEAQKV
ncbi:MAG: hypothetical protein RLZZ292_754 [Bacteroidota bacterium]|jgi:hypothetical protein